MTQMVNCAAATGTGSRRRDLLTMLTALNIVCLLLLWVAESLFGERYWPAALLLHAPQQGFGIPAIVLLLWAIRHRKNWKTLYGNLCVLVFFTFSFLGVNVPLHHKRSASPGGGLALRVMSYNIAHGSAGVEQVVAAVRRARPEVLCLQEANAGEGGHDPVPEIRRLLPGWHLSRYGELVTLSRYPVLSQRIHRLPTRVGCGVLQTEINAPGRRLTVFNVHLINPIDGPIASWPSEIGDRATVRARQRSVLLRVVNAASSPLIIAGDFNNPPRGSLYNTLTSRFHDAFQDAGWGVGYTFHAALPAIRIDYIFSGPQVQAIRCHVLNERSSDHRPVMAEVVLHRNTKSG